MCERCGEGEKSESRASLGWERLSGLVSYLLSLSHIRPREEQQNRGSCLVVRKSTRLSVSRPPGQPLSPAFASWSGLHDSLTLPHHQLRRLQVTSFFHQRTDSAESAESVNTPIPSPSPASLLPPEPRTMSSVGPRQAAVFVLDCSKSMAVPRSLTEGSGEYERTRMVPPVEVMLQYVRAKIAQRVSPVLSPCGWTTVRLDLRTRAELELPIDPSRPGDYPPRRRHLRRRQDRQLRFDAGPREAGRSV